MKLLIFVSYFQHDRWVSWKHEDDKVIAFERGQPTPCLFVFNFHPTRSYTDYKLGVETPGVYKVVLDSDAEEFGGHNRLDHNVEHHTFNEAWAGRKNSIMVYIPSRTAIVLAKVR